ncbi:HAMP domain-containing protein [Butyrivibrio sp. CB08]|uniref:cache domain-containing sensor histidine kinase n=1 Tax=Butyrivibrio sp. CB08 TaxID=2364879 RepID=UPI000EA86457|nr:sensor histidine kinase [Butyrivibrio sp. CB08]RKM61895.1 HAMP domain-containing protein [Butyrivibrio sp. CB08]
MNKGKWTMRQAVLGLVIGCTLFAIVTQTVVFEVISRQQIRRESLLNNDETLERIESEINSYIHSNIVKMQAIYNEEDLVYAMRHSDKNRERLLDYYFTAWHMSERRFDSSDQLLAMYIYDKNDHLVSSHRKQPYNYPHDLYETDQYVNASHLQSYLESDDYAVLLSGYHNEVADQDVMRLVLKLHTYGDDRSQFGYMVCDFSTFNISEIMSKYISSRDVYVWLQPQGDAPIAQVGNTTKEESKLFSQLTKLVATSSEEFPQLRDESGSFYLNSRPFSDYNLHIIMLTPQSLMMHTQSALARTLAVIAVFIILVTLLVGIIFSGFIYRPVEELSNTIIKIKNGDTELRAKTDGWSQELKVMGDEFNEMLDQIGQMVQEEYEAKVLMERTQYKVLQAQINPHFLFNTLDTMSGIAASQNCNLVSGLCQSLSAIFRYSLDISDTQSTLQQEMAHVRNFLYVMDVRNGNTVKYNYQIDSDTLDDNIPRITLQPIVENALQHGLRNTRRKDKELTITAKHEGGELVITIEDNGAGMDAAAMNEQLEKADIGRIEMGRSIGVMNVNARVKSVYGSGYGIHYESSIDEGTKAVIRLPIVKQEVKDGGEVQGFVS